MLHYKGYLTLQNVGVMKRTGHQVALIVVAQGPIRTTCPASGDRTVGALRHERPDGAAILMACMSDAKNLKDGTTVLANMKKGSTLSPADRAANKKAKARIKALKAVLRIV